MWPTGHELRELLSPYEVQDFLRDHWDGSPLYIPGPATKFAPLSFDLSTLEGVIRRRDRSGRLQVRFVGSDNAVKPAPDPLEDYSVRDGQVTACADWISDRFERLAAFCVGIKTGLNLPGPVFMSCFASPEGHGLGTHLDCHPSFILQLEGSKVWRFSPHPAVAWSPANVPSVRAAREMTDRYPWLQLRFPDEEEERTFREQVLTPGDVLFLPAGTWHRTRAIGCSLSLTMTCVPLTAADFVNDLIRGHLSGSVEWRRSVPPVPAAKTPSNRLPRAVERFFEARLSELREHVRSLAARDLYETWTHHVHSSDTPFLKGEDGPRSIEETDILKVAGEAPLHYVANRRHRSLALYYLDRRVDLEYAALPLVKAMLAASSFPARVATRWLNGFAWQDVEPLLRGLVHAGILRVEARGEGGHPQAIPSRLPRARGRSRPGRWS